MNPKTRSLTLAHLYPDLMNLYGDRGNVMALAERCRRRNIELRVVPVGQGDPLPIDTDVIFMGGGQDWEQRRVAADLLGKQASLRAAIEDGTVALTICGGFQLFGRCYRPAEGPELLGLGIFDAVTEHPGGRIARCIGNVVVDWQGQTLVGFENHGGRTTLGPDAQPLGRVLRGHGNNSRDRSEGAVYKNAFGTYLHGPLLPKNPHFADHLLALALERKYGASHLEPLPDSGEKAAHRRALEVARYRPRIDRGPNPP